VSAVEYVPDEIARHAAAAPHSECIGMPLTGKLKARCQLFQADLSDLVFVVLLPVGPEQHLDPATTYASSQISARADQSVLETNSH
jgi:hypothetical protein